MIVLVFRLAINAVEQLASLGSVVAHLIARREWATDGLRAWVVQVCWSFRDVQVSPTYRLRGVSIGNGSGDVGILPSGADLPVLVSSGHRGSLRLCDAELPAFEVVLASREAIGVCVEAGALSFDNPTFEACVTKPVSPLFGKTRSIVVGGGTRVALRGGEWGVREDPTGYRVLGRRQLIGTPANPIFVAFSRAANSSEPQTP